MPPPLTNDSDYSRSQVGIGTLIIFIAMVLVATVASGVLINTAGFLQSQSEETGEDSSQQVIDRIQVFSSVGNFSEQDVDVQEGAIGDDDNIVVQESQFNSEPDNAVREGDATEPITSNVVTVDGRNVVANGGNAETEDGVDVVREDGVTAEVYIDGTIVVESDGTNINVKQENENIGVLSGTTNEDERINVETENGINVVPAKYAPDVFEQTKIELVVGVGPGSDQVDLDRTTLEYLGPDGATTLVSKENANSGRPTFGIERIKGESTDNVLTDNSDRSKIVINLDGSNDALQPLSKNDEVHLTLVTASGAQTQVQLTVPSSVPDEGVVGL